MTASAKTAGEEQVVSSVESKLWEVGLKSFQNGDVATTGIQKIWAAMGPPANLNLVAKITGALWADTFWKQTKMDVEHLAMNISSALSLNLKDAQKAAAFAFSRWSGLLVRGNTGNSGEIPRSGALTASMDVVINGQNALSAQQLIKMWGQTRWAPQPGLKNYAYGRAQSSNIGVPVKEGKLMGFYSDAGFNPPPSSWVQMFTYDGSSSTAPLETMVGKVIDPDSRAATGDSNGFAFEPPGSGHYCLVIVAQTEFFSNEPLANGGNWNSWEWLTHNGAAGWHNVNVATEAENYLKFYNQDDRPEQFVFEAHCSKLPPGSRVILRAADDHLDAISNGEIIKNPHQVITAQGRVPPRYEGHLLVVIETPGGEPLPPYASVEVRQLWELGPGHKHYNGAVHHLGDLNAHALHEHVQLVMGDYTFTGPGYGQ